jgi:CubicO group peptidase (beta-lactamase class C family)
MAGLVVRESVTLAGRAERARVARAFVDGVLGPGHPCGDAAVLLGSFSSTVSGTAARVPPARRDGRSRSQGSERRHPRRGHRPERARGAAAAPCRWPAYGVTRLITAAAVLRLAAEGRVRLDDPANDHLRTVRLADGAVTIRELLSYAGGVDTPALGSGYADTVPALASLFGPVLPCSGNRGTASRGRHGDYAALGQLIADVTGSDYAVAVARLVLGPLGMASSTFPASWPHDDPDAVTGYELEPDGTFLPDLDDVAVIPAAAGLWTTAADLIKFCTGWSSLLPDDLAGEALRPQAAEADGPGQAGLGWRLNTSRGFAFEVGNGPGGSSSLIVKAGDGRAYVALTNRKAPQVAALNVRVLLNGS